MLDNPLARLNNAVRKFDTMGRLKEGILSSVRDGSDSFRLSDIESGQHSARIFYKYMCEALSELPSAEIAPTMKKKAQADLEERIGQFERAAISVIADREIYFTKTAYGNPGTLSEYVGHMTSGLLQRVGISPNRQSGHIAEMVMPLIEYGAIVNGEVRHRNDERRFTHNNSLLSLLFCVRTEKVPNGDYWNLLGNNEDFVPLLYGIMKEMQNQEARALVPRMIAAHFRIDSKAADNFWLAADLREDFGDPWSDFLNEPDNKFDEVFRGNISQTPVLTPKTISFDYNREGVSTLILSSYRETQNSAKASFYIITDTINHYNLSLNPNTLELPGHIPTDIAEKMSKMILDFTFATRQYTDVLKQRLKEK